VAFENPISLETIEAKAQAALDAAAAAQAAADAAQADADTANTAAGNAMTQALAAIDSANAAQLTADDATGDAAFALATANGKNKIIHSTAAASGTTGYVTNDLWVRYSGGVIIGAWRFSGGAWVAESIGSQFIASLDAGKITTGELVGIIITGTWIRTAATGRRVELLDDGIGGTIKFFNAIGSLIGSIESIVDTLYFGNDTGAYFAVSQLGSQAFIEALNIFFTGDIYHSGGVASFSALVASTFETFQARLGANGTNLNVVRDGESTGNTNGSGEVTVNHGLGVTPRRVLISAQAGALGRDVKEVPGSRTSTQFTVRGRDAAGAVLGSGLNLPFDWVAIG
jgi:hypothetical protein